MRKAVRFLSWAIAGGLIPTSALGGEPRLKSDVVPDPPELIYRDSVGQVARLSREDQIPFQLSDDVPRFDYILRRVKTAVEGFPSVRACLTTEQQSAQQPDLSQIDWKRLGRHEHAVVCLFRIATSYQSREDVFRWFQHQQFRTRAASRPDGGLSIIAEWPLKQLPVPIPVETYQMLHDRIADRVLKNATVTFGSDPGKVSVNMTFTFIYWD